MKEPNNFSRKYPGLGVTFICDMCGKRTRDTGDNGSCKLCPKCYKECEEENMESDGVKNV